MKRTLKVAFWFVVLVVLVVQFGTTRSELSPRLERILSGLELAASFGFIAFLIVSIRSRWHDETFRRERRPDIAMVLALLAGIVLVWAVAPTEATRWIWVIGLVRTYLLAMLGLFGLRFLSERHNQTRNPATIFVGTFATVILMGTILLSLPKATASGERLDVLDAFFTATSATCVTGLAVVDTGSVLSAFGQGVVLVLIQLGGLGLMTFAAFVALALGRGLPVREQATIREMLSVDDVGGVPRFVVRILVFTAVTELAGCLVLWWCFRSGTGSNDPARDRPFYFAFFHAISSFCNAGFSLYRDSFVSYQRSVIVQMVLVAEIILGGLGFLVVFDLVSFLRYPFRRRREVNGVETRGPRPRLSLQSRIVLLVSGCLIVFGFAAVLIAEWNNGRTLGPMSWPDRCMAALFQSVTARTAGLNTIDEGQLTAPSKLVTISLMLIGASPGSTGGGLKTVTAFIVLAAVGSIFHNQQRTQIFRRSVPREITNRALIVLTLFLMLIFVAMLVLVAADLDTAVAVAAGEKARVSPFLDLLFEVISALGTFGLSTGLTAHLSATSRVCLIVVMFIGRTGPLTLVMAMRAARRRREFDYPEERVMIG